MAGQQVCYHHGGAAKQNVNAAKRRLMEASNDMAVLLMRIAEDDSTPAAVRVVAIKDVLDRAGVTSKTEVEITVQPWQELVHGIVAEVADDDIARVARVLATRDGVDLPVLDAEVVYEQPTPRPRPLPTSQALVPSEVRIPSRRKKKGANWS